MTGTDQTLDLQRNRLNVYDESTSTTEPPRLPRYARSGSQSIFGSRAPLRCESVAVFIASLTGAMFNKRYSLGTEAETAAATLELEELLTRATSWDWHPQSNEFHRGIYVFKHDWPRILTKRVSISPGVLREWQARPVFMTSRDDGDE